MKTPTIVASTRNDEPLGESPGGARSLPQLLIHQSAVNGDRVALRQKARGRWVETDFATYHRRSAAVGLGLRALGVGHGDRVAIHAENRQEWVIAALGAQGIGAISTGVYTTSPPAEVEYLLSHSRSKVLIVEDERQFDKAWEVRDRLPDLQKIVVLETRGIRDLDDDMVLTFEELEALGAPDGTGPWDAMAAAVGDDDPTLIIYTSGTTGPPKGAMVSNGNLIWCARTLATTLDAGVGDEVLSYLPLSHIAEGIFSLISALRSGVTVNFGEKEGDLGVHLREVQPTILLGVPRIWERMMATVQIRIQDASPAKRLAYRTALRLTATSSTKAGPAAVLTQRLAWVLAFRTLRHKLGLARVRAAFSGAAPIAPEVMHFFAQMGVPIREGYGMTESSGLITFTPADDIRPGLVGKALPQAEVAIAEDGEILARHGGVFLGYLDDPQATAETIDEDGWLHTGDIGELTDDGHLKITDRKKHIIITAGGKNISPSEIENKLKVSPYIRDSVVIGDQRKYLVALVGIEHATVGDWAARRGIAYTTYEDLSSLAPVRELIQAAVDEANADLAQVETIKYFAFITKELDPEDGDVTATQKVKRQTIVEQYAEQIEAMYAVRQSS